MFPLFPVGRFGIWYVVYSRFPMDVVQMCSALCCKGWFSDFLNGVTFVKRNMLLWWRWRSRWFESCCVDLWRAPARWCPIGQESRWSLTSMRISDLLVAPLLVRWISWPMSMRTSLRSPNKILQVMWGCWSFNKTKIRFVISWDLHGLESTSI